ncbi:hypothetical protein [Persicobacter psychrovividus]|uniref:Uncharacterized protein n=1 Tax=Persicobacter psychrovividus TaxID=387638 RepID=A0ABM7VK90_9BACT|nr:hypothetical protein PEPS_36960 [Persicobacter psychrovividus]
MRTSKDITNTPKTSDLNKWADYIELLCLKNPDGLLTCDALYDRITDEKDSTDDDNEDTGITESESNDRLMQKVIDRFTFVSSRVHHYLDFYPFEFDTSENIIYLKKELFRKHYFYLYLLYSSNLDYYKEHMSDLTSNFELISTFSLKSHLPRFTQVHSFGKSKIKSKKFNQNKLSDKIRELSKELRLELSPYFSEDKISGDFGLDIVAWYNHDNNEAGPIFFGQCACGFDWEAKQFDAHYDKWKNCISFRHPPVSTIYIPKSFRDTSGLWLDDMKIYSTIVFDRLRILKRMYRRYLKEIHKISKPFVDKELKEKLAVAE